MVDCLAVTARNEMAINIDSDLNTGMAKLIFYVNRALPIAQKKTGERMPNRIKLHIPYPCPSKNLLPDITDTILSDWFIPSVKNKFFDLTLP